MVKVQSGYLMRDSGKLIRWQKEMMMAACFQSHIKCQTLILMDLTVGFICWDVPPSSLLELFECIRLILLVS